MLQRTNNIRLPDAFDLTVPEERKAGELTRVMALILAQLARNRAPRNYSMIGRMLPGIPRQPRGDFTWVDTGQHHPIKLRKGRAGNGKPEVYMSKIYTLRPTMRKWAKEASWRTAA